ncbi:MAG TPA: GAF domain-containing protein [Candidatus Gastranaerophilaceae bacterium]|nr:GAF domain-containing protein [Candidatus Gastranaerophilaceae bacterium]HPT41146.1 GAF domain-containing protein [Candidatus Gastranaerophilaceae bacterium]
MVVENIKNEHIKQGEFLIRKALDEFLNKSYKEAFSAALSAQKLFIQEKSSENISICLSLLGVIEYLGDKSKYLSALTYLNDGKYLAECTKNTTAKLINEFMLGNLDFIEKNSCTAIIHYENALKIAKRQDEYGLIEHINSRMKQLNSSCDFSTPEKHDPLVALLRIGQTVSAETDINTLLEVIAQETKSAIQADRCSVFLYDRENNELWSKVALGMESEEIRFPADKGLAGHVVQTGETINIKDAYSDDRFNKEIDLKTGYVTKTILCMPIKNLNQEIIGAFQVLNKNGGEFKEEDEDLLVAIGSSAGIALENAQLFKKQGEMLEEQKQVFDSFMDTLAASIDARDKITAGHSTRVRLYSSLIAKAMNMDEKNVEIIEKAATLHDIGKIGIRDSVLQKEGKLTDEEYKHIQEHAEITHNILEKIHMSDEFKLVTEIACSHHEKFNGNGYYRHLSGEDIPLGGRVLAVSDVFDAITSKRHYRDKMPIMNVIEILLKDSGTHFDSQIIQCFLSIPTNKIVEVFMTENHLTFEEEHKKILEKYSMMDLYNLSTQKQPEELSEDEKIFIDLFNFYYTAKSSKDDQN